MDKIMHKTKKIIIFSCLFLLLFSLLILLKSCSYNFKSYDELSKMLRIDLTNGINVQDVIVEDYIIETRVVMFYQVEDSVFQNDSKYSFKTDYNPVPSLNKNENIGYTMSEYFTEFDLKYEDLDYINTEFSTISNRDFEIRLFIFSNTNTNTEHNVVLIADIPTRLKLKQ